MTTTENELTGGLTPTAVISKSKSTTIVGTNASDEGSSKHEEKTESIGNTLKSKTKHKHHGRHCHHARKHHRRCRHRVRSHPISGTPLKVIIPNRPATKVVKTDDQQVPAQTKDAEVKGNIPLQSVENTIKSQRPASTDETQVGNYATLVNSCCTPQVQQVCYDDSCCLPSSCANTCVVEQVEPLLCLPSQPQQQQLYYCTDSAPAVTNLISSASFVQRPQQYICVGNAPTTLQPNIIIQAQPQIQQFGGQYVEIASAGPQLIQAIPSMAGGQMIQIAPLTSAASPQLLYQRPYDPVVFPVQNQPMMIGNAPLVSLSQPSYAPSRVVVPAAPDRQAALGPNMFRHALIRTVANRVGLPVLSPGAAGGGLQLVQPPMTAPGRLPITLGTPGARGPINPATCSVM